MQRFWRSASVAALTGGLFVVVYNACNYLTRLRSDVGTWAFSWERHWPVIPWMIVPYWSIDLLFVIGAFLCTTREEVAAHRRRLTFCILVAAIFFLLIPLRFAFPRPHVDGLFAPWFAALYSFDLPHNLFPSLHLAFRTILTDVFARKAPGIWRWVVHIWFSLIGISTLLTWQHHLVDVLGGFWLAAMAIHLFPVKEERVIRSGNWHVAIYYAIAAIACTQLARLAWPWTFLFTWPAFSFVLAAFGYAGFGAGIYRKREGRLTLLTKMLMAPLLFAQWLSWKHYRRKSDRWNAITPNVWIGSHPTPQDAREAAAAGVTAVVDLTVEFTAVETFRGLRYHHVPVLDLTAPSAEQFTEAIRVIETEAERGIVYVHCKAGYSRSAGIVGAWLLTTGRAKSVEEAIETLRAARRGIVIRLEIRRALESIMTGKFADDAACKKCG